MVYTIEKLHEQYGENFESLFPEDKAEIAGVILLWTSLRNPQGGRFSTLLDLSKETSRYLVELSEAASECLCEISLAQFDRPTLLNICNNLLTGYH